MMTFFSAEERGFASKISRIADVNPFLPERTELDRSALGDLYLKPAARPIAPGPEAAWELGPNTLALMDRTKELICVLMARRRSGAAVTDSEWGLFEDLVLFDLYHRHASEFSDAMRRALEPGGRLGAMGFFDEFRDELGATLGERARRLAPAGVEPAVHVFAAFFQMRRAFHCLNNYLVGASAPMVRLRAAAWESIFTHNIRRYRRGIFDLMREIPSLVTGPTGSGKELVARAIGLSSYVPFDPRTRTFAGDVFDAFKAINLAAMAPTLIESEMFGHRRGAFTGALDDHPGWFATCPPFGAVFLDEIGELDLALQVKLLRLLQTRQFQRIGDTKTQVFQGKIIAATHRDLNRMIGEGEFREDLYYRLCADQLRTPTLREQLDDAPGDLPAFVGFVARRLVTAGELDSFTGEVVQWIERNLPSDYAWAGNFRELEQCVRNLMIRRDYRPSAPHTQGESADARERLASEVVRGEMALETMQRHYCSLVYARMGSYQAAARVLQTDHRTVKSRIDAELVEAYRNAAGGEK